jgi:hypothetical protein
MFILWRKRIAFVAAIFVAAVNAPVDARVWHCVTRRMNRLKNGMRFCLLYVVVV